MNGILAGALTTRSARMIAFVVALWGGDVAASELVGILLDGAGRYQIPYAKIEVCPEGESTCHEAMTDREGVFRVPDLDPGVYEIRFLGKAGDEITKEVQVGPGQEPLRLQDY